MRSNEKKYRRSFRNIDRWSSLAWMQEWRIVMRIVSAAAFSDAYRLVMFTTAGLAAMSAITTELMISSGRN